ncbi:hypothetical protein ABEB36_011719 [Hypothenemus hampei]
MTIIGLNKRDDPTKRRNAAKKYICAILEHLNCNLHGLQKFSGRNIENENRNESSAFYMVSSHDETQPETPPTSAATSPSLPHLHLLQVQQYPSRDPWTDPSRGQ